MLNEGYTLCKSLDHHRIRTNHRHPCIYNPGKREGIVVGINQKGAVSRIEYRTAEDIAKLWTIREGKHNSFPIVKLQHPLWKLDRSHAIRMQIDEHAKDENSNRDLLCKQKFTINLTKTELDWWGKIRNRAADLLPLFSETIEPEVRVFQQLMERVLHVTSMERFTKELIDAVKQSAAELPFSFVENILIGSKWDSSKNEYHVEIPLVLDVDDWDNISKYTKRVASSQLEPYISDRLFKIQSAGQLGVSALSGGELILENHTFPCPKLPIGETYLFAVNTQTPCQTRYNKSGAEIIPIGRVEACSIQDSLNWVTDSDREGKTWWRVPGKKDGDTELLIVYLDDNPNADAHYAHMIGGTITDDFREDLYEKIAASAIKAFNGRRIEATGKLIRLVVLRKADPGRSQVSMQRVFTIADLIDADTYWQIAAKNIPETLIPFFRHELLKENGHSAVSTEWFSKFIEDKNAKVIFVQPPCPFPADLIRLTHRKWIQSGNDFRKLSGHALGEIYDVYFDRSNELRELTNHLLRTTLNCTEPLLIGYGHAEHRMDLKGGKNKKVGSFDKNKRQTVMKTLSALGIYLYKLGVKKEDYMKDAFFNIGRCMSLIDTLHLEYCRHVRGGDIPPQLLGNAHLQIALDNPVSAFDMLSRRISIYQAWAQRENDTDIRLARWAVGEIGKVAEILSERTLPSATNSAQRAQILLGYLSKHKKDHTTEIDTGAN